MTVKEVATHLPTDSKEDVVEEKEGRGANSVTLAPSYTSTREECGDKCVAKTLSGSTPDHQLATPGPLDEEKAREREDQV